MKRLLLPFFLAGFTLTYSQPLSLDDYARATSFLWENVNNKKAYNLSLVPNWLPDSTGLWFVHYIQGEKKYDKVLFKPQARSPLFNHAALAGKLSELLKETVDAKALPLENISVMKGDLIQFTAKGKRFSWKNGAGELTLRTDKDQEENQFESKSPDGKWIAYTENYNLYVKSTADGAVKQLSTKGTKNYEYASYYGWSDIIEGENGERPRRFMARWSPDSKYIQTNICDLRSARKM